jgi:hypothetical protein
MRQHLTTLDSLNFKETTMSSNSIYHNPYTYLIGWSQLNKFYYGVRFAKGCRPDDLWNSYFTSSKHVEKLRHEVGEPDIIQVRKTFADGEAALSWEHKVLQRMCVVKDERFLNRYDGMETTANCESFNTEVVFGHQLKSPTLVFTELAGSFPFCFVHTPSLNLCYIPLGWLFTGLHYRWHSLILRLNLDQYLFFLIISIYLFHIEVWKIPMVASVDRTLIRNYDFLTGPLCDIRMFI